MFKKPTLKALPSSLAKGLQSPLLLYIDGNLFAVNIATIH